MTQISYLWTPPPVYSLPVRGKAERPGRQSPLVRRPQISREDRPRFMQMIKRIVDENNAFSRAAKEAG